MFEPIIPAQSTGPYQIAIYTMFLLGSHERMSHQDTLSRRRYALVPCTCSEEEVKEEGSYEALGGMDGWIPSDLLRSTTLFPSRRIECSVGPGYNFGSDRHAV